MSLREVLPQFTLKNVKMHVWYRILVGAVIGAFVVFPYLVHRIDAAS